jgi:formylglycine-generating enzyme required for sulfatase activity
LYDELDLSPQAGLIPIGTDPHSGLWEFAHLATGTPPSRGEGGWLVLNGETGIVLVLVPINTVRAKDNEDGSRVVSTEAKIESEDVQQTAMFISKYEVTQEQWTRTMGSNPSEYQYKWIVKDNGQTFVPSDLQSEMHPVENISPSLALAFCDRVELRLPTKAEWNLAAQTSIDWSPSPRTHALRWFHSPVGSRKSNPYGLHDVFGNVWEWVTGAEVSAFIPELEMTRMRKDSLAVKGGGVGIEPADVWVQTSLSPGGAADRLEEVGLRPARTIERH